MLTSRRTNSSSNAQKPGEAKLAVLVFCIRFGLLLSSICAASSNGTAGIVGFCRIDWIRGVRGFGTHARTRLLQLRASDSCRNWNACQATLVMGTAPLSLESAQQPNASEISTEPKRIGHNSSTRCPEKSAQDTES